MCDTIVQTVKILMENGAKNVIVIVTHAILSSPDLERFINNDHIIKFICSDTLPQEKNKTLYPKMQVWSCAPLMGEVIKRLIDGRSI